MTATATALDKAHPPDDAPFAVQDRRRKGFFTIDNEFIDRFGPLVGPGGIAVFNVLARFADQESECFPSQGTIARLAGMSRMQVSRELRKLRELNVIAVENQFASNGSQRSNLYILLDLPPVTDSYTPYNTQLHPPVTDSYTPRNGQLHLKNNTQENNTQKEQDSQQQHRPRRKRSKRTTTTLLEGKKDVVVVLTNLGISESVARQLASRYSRERVLEKIAYLEFLQEEDPDKTRNPQGWLRRAIEEDYGKPDGFTTMEEREQQKVEAERNAQEAAEQERTREGARQALREKKKAEEEARRWALSAKYGTTQREIDLWQYVLADLKLQLPEATFDSFVAESQLLSVQGEQAVVGLARHGAKEWVENRLTKSIQSLLTQQLAGKKVTVQFVTLEVDAA